MFLACHAGRQIVNEQLLIIILHDPGNNATSLYPCINKSASKVKKHLPLFSQGSRLGKHKKHAMFSWTGNTEHVFPKQAS
jgi:hypothetical protein